MSNNYRWKDKYYDYNSVELSNPLYVSKAGSVNTSGSKNDPKITVTEHRNNILSSGYFEVFYLAPKPGNTTIYHGQGYHNTIINNLISSTEGYRIVIGCTINSCTAHTVQFYECCLNYPIHPQNKIINCLLLASPLYTITYASISIVGTELLLQRISGQNIFFSNCNITITSSDITSKSSFYLAYSNCRFKIAEESEYLPLIGNTEEELRANFAARCEAQGIVIPENSEYNDPKMKMYRWVFSNDKNDHGYVIKDSIIDKFQQRRMIRFGWKSEPVLPLEITTDTTRINSLSTKTKEVLIDDENQSIRFADNIDIANIDNGAQIGKVRSNIIWLGEGKQKLDSVNILHNLATQYGVMIDSDPAIVPIEKDTIEEGQMYLVRSKSNKKETIIYNNESYSTALSDNNNIFVGVDGVNNWICDDYDSIVVYKITDLAISNTIRMRIVDEIPEDTVVSVVKDVWYFVQPKDLSNSSGSVIYNGTEYPCFGSFKAGDETSFQIKGDCRLRRCWKDNFDLDTDADKNFWINKQKPIWFDVVPDDMRCLLKRNNPLSVEMESDDKGYITSGHPDFYSLVGADNGVPRPAYDITGKYLQIELVISTLNPM